MQITNLTSKPIALILNPAVIVQPGEGHTVTKAELAYLESREVFRSMLHCGQVKVVKPKAKKKTKAKK